MSKVVNIPASIWNQMREDIRTLAEAIQIKDLVNEKQACDILGIQRNTLGNYIKKNKVQVESISSTGEMFFSERKLKGKIIQGQS